MIGTPNEDEYEQPDCLDINDTGPIDIASGTLDLGGANGTTELNSGASITGPSSTT